MRLSFSQEPQLLVATPSLWTRGELDSALSQAGKSKSWGNKSRPAFKLQVQVVPIVITSVRLAPATLPLQFSGVRQATSFGAVCPQQAMTPPGGAANVSTSSSLTISEDCRSATYTYCLSN